METWDILDNNGFKTGRYLLRSDKLKNGEYHLVVHVWIIDTNGNILIQKRPENVEWMPSVWSTTGGSVIKNEKSLNAVIRETAEELGLVIKTEKFRFLKRYKGVNDFTDVFIVRGDKEEFSPIILNDEVADSDWVTILQLKEMINIGSFINYQYLPDIFDYLDNY